MATNATAARASHLTKVYGNGAAQVIALDDVSVDFRRAEFTAVMGPSGSGKSTLMHCCAGLDVLDAGKVWIDDVDITGLSDNRLTQLRRDIVGFIFQSFNLVPTLSAKENIVLPLSIAGKRVDENWLKQIIDIVGLGDRLSHRPNELSGGQQQRVACARAMITKPAIIFADEPTGNLDSEASTDVLDFLRQSVDRFGQSIVMVTHDPVAAAYADRAIFLVDGRIAGELYNPTRHAVLDMMARLDPRGRMDHDQRRPGLRPHLLGQDPRSPDARSPDARSLEPRGLDPRQLGHGQDDLYRPEQRDMRQPSMRDQSPVTAPLRALAELARKPRPSRQAPVPPRMEHPMERPVDRLGEPPRNRMAEPVDVWDSRQQPPARRAEPQRPLMPQEYDRPRSYDSATQQWHQPDERRDVVRPRHQQSAGYPRSQASAVRPQEPRPLRSMEAGRPQRMGAERGMDRSQQRQPWQPPYGQPQYARPTAPPQPAYEPAQEVHVPPMYRDDHPTDSPRWQPSPRREPQIEPRPYERDGFNVQPREGRRPRRALED